jgi:hypothetical protein
VASFKVSSLSATACLSLFSSSHKSILLTLILVVIILCVIFWVFPRHLIIECRRFGTLCLFHLQRLAVRCEVIIFLVTNALGWFTKNRVGQGEMQHWAERSLDSSCPGHAWVVFPWLQCSRYSNFHCSCVMFEQWPTASIVRLIFLYFKRQYVHYTDVSCIMFEQQLLHTDVSCVMFEQATIASMVRLIFWYFKRHYFQYTDVGCIMFEQQLLHTDVSCVMFEQATTASIVRLIFLYFKRHYFQYTDVSCIMFE